MKLPASIDIQQKTLSEFQHASRDDLILEVKRLRELQSQLERDRNILERVLNSYSDVVYAGNEQEIWWFNRPFLETFGIDDEETSRMGVLGLLDRVDARSFETGKRLRKDETAPALALKGQTVVQTITIYPYHTGEEKVVRCTALPYRAGSGVNGTIVIHFDVTNQIKTNKALKESEARFRMLADTAPILIWMSDSEKQCTYVNKIWLDFTGRPLQQELGLGWTEGIHPDDLEPCLATYADSFDNRKVFEMEFRLRRKDDAYRWILFHGRPRHLPGGEFAGYIGSCIDITDRKYAEAERDELLKREQALRAEAEEAQKRAIFLAEASTELASSLDYETTLQRVASLIVPRLADWCAVDLLVDNGKLDMVAVAHKDPEKIKFARELRHRFPPVPDEKSGLSHVMQTGLPEFYPVITDDILVAAARNSEHLALIRQIGFRSAILMPLIAHDQIFGVLTFVWSDSNRHYTNQDLLFAEELARRVAVAVDNSRLYKALQTERSNLEERIRNRTEELSRLNNFLRQQAKEKENAQQALARSHRTLELRNRELQDFAYVASHDLQEPLRKIRTFTQLLTVDHKESLNQEGRLFLERIDHAASRMSQLITDLLTYSRIATRAQAYQIVDLEEVLNDVLIDLEISLTESGGKIEADTLCKIEADALQIRQLFQNLIGNALKFHRKGVAPHVHISAHHEMATFFDLPPQPACRLEIKDNGIGFNESFLDRIFAPFQRLHGPGAYPGTGMGLAICRRIVERHHGQITARSKPEEGSTFIVTLPLTQDAWSKSDEPSLPAV